MSTTKYSLPNEILLLICNDLDPYDYDDHKTLLALSAVSKAARQFTTPAAFKLWRLGGGQGLERAKKEAFSMAMKEHPMTQYIERLEIDLDSLLPAAIKDGVWLETKSPIDRRWKLIHDNALDFHALLGVVFRLCGDFGHVEYLWVEPGASSIEDLISYGGYDWSSEYDGANEVVCSLGGISDIVVTVYSNNQEDKYPEAEGESLMQHFIYRQELKNLHIDFGHNHLVRASRGTDISPLVRYEYWPLRSLNLQHFVEGPKKYLYRLLDWCKVLEEFHLVECAVARDEYNEDDDSDGGDEPEPPSWSLVFNACEKRTHLRDIYFDRLRYVPAPEKETRSYSPLPGWKCGIPLYTTLPGDFLALESIRKSVLERRKEHSQPMPYSKWLDTFLEEPECKQLLMDDGSLPYWKDELEKRQKQYEHARRRIFGRILEERGDEDGNEHLGDTDVGTIPEL